MPLNGKITRPLVRSAVYSQAFGRLDMALAKNTHSDIAEHEKTQLWLLKIFGQSPEPGKTQNIIMAENNNKRSQGSQVALFLSVLSWQFQFLSIREIRVTA